VGLKATVAQGKDGRGVRGGGGGGGGVLGGGFWGGIENLPGSDDDPNHTTAEEGGGGVWSTKKKKLVPSFQHHGGFEGIYCVSGVLDRQEGLFGSLAIEKGECRKKKRD